MDVLRDDHGNLVDDGRWRERGVTHWHLVRTDWDRSDRARFDGERIDAERRHPTHGIARSPHEVAAWIVAEKRRAAAEAGDPGAALARSGLCTAADWALREEMTFASAVRGADSLALQNMGGERIAHINAYAMTATTCGCDRRG
jgi:hypothetical protein